MSTKTGGFFFVGVDVAKECSKDNAPLKKRRPIGKGLEYSDDG